jgi:hypothetical protein
MMMNKEFVQYQNNLFYVYRKIKSDNIKDGYLDDLKKYWDCDIVVKNKNQENNDILFFLKKIEEAELVD